MKNIVKIFYTIFIAFFGWIILNILFRASSNWIISIVVAVILGGLMYSVSRCNGIEDIEPQKEKKVVSIWLGVLVITQIIMGYLLQVDNTYEGDYGAIISAAKVLANGEEIEVSYFAKYPNNLFCLL